MKKKPQFQQRTKDSDEKNNGSGQLERWTPGHSHRLDDHTGDQQDNDNNQQAVQVNSGQLPLLTANSEYPEGMFIDLRMSTHLNLKKQEKNKKGRKTHLNKDIFQSNNLGELIGDEREIKMLQQTQSPLKADLPPPIGSNIPEELQLYQYMRMSDQQFKKGASSSSRGGNRPRGNTRSTNREKIGSRGINAPDSLIRQQAKSVLAGKNLNSKPMRDNQAVSIEDVIQKQFEKRNQNENDTSPSNFQCQQPYSKISHYMPTTPDFRVYTQIINGKSGVKQVTSPFQDINDRGFMNQNRLPTLEEKKKNSPQDEMPAIQGHSLLQYQPNNKAAETQATHFDDEFLQNQPTFKDYIQKQYQNTSPTTLSTVIGGRSSASQDYRQKFKVSGFDPKALMTQTLGRDPKNIQEILQYKNYEMETYKEKRDQMSKPRMKNSRLEPRVHVDALINRGTSQLAKRDKPNTTARHISSVEHYQDQYRIVKNTYAPNSIKESHVYRNDIAPLATIKVPDKLKEAFQKRGRKDSFNQLMQQQSDLLSPHSLKAYNLNMNDYLDKKFKQNRYVQYKSNITPSNQSDSEYVIKNYRLVYQKKKDFFLPTAHSMKQSPIRASSLTPQDSEASQIAAILSPQPAGTTIRVSNSILTPNTFHFSTKVTLGRILQQQLNHSTDEIPSLITDELKQLSQEQQQPNYMSLLRQHKQSPEKQTPEQKSPQQTTIIEEPEKDEQSPDMIFKTNDLSKISPIKVYQDQLTIMPLRILDTPRIESEAGSTDRAQLIEENFKDILQSWFSRGNGYSTTNPHQFVDSENEDDDFDLNEISKEISDIRLYDLTRSFDSFNVEAKMIKGLKTHKQHIRDQIKHPDDHEALKVPDGDTTGLEPYGHLKARNVLTKQLDEFNRRIELTMPNVDHRSKAKVMIELRKDFMTHLDLSNFTVDRLPLEIFDDFLLEADSIKERIEKKKSQNLPPLQAYTQYFRTSGAIEEITCDVLDYDEPRKKFIIQFLVEGRTIKKYQSRLNLTFIDYDSRESIKERRDLAIKLRRHTMFKLNAERLFIQELAKKYDFIKLPQYIRDNIMSKLVIDIKLHNQEHLQLLALQVEAHFVFSILKSIIYSQLSDPFISRIVAQYKIEDFTVSRSEIRQEVQDYRPKVPFYALKAYEERSGKLERMLNKQEAQKVLEEYGILGKKSFIEVIQFMTKQNEEMVAITPIFEFPVTNPKLYVFLLSCEDFKGKTMEDLESRLQVFPAQMHNLVKSQKAIAKKFKDMLEGRWTESLARKVEQIVEKEFKFNSEGKEVLRSNINPYLLKLFEFIRFQQEKILYDKLVDTIDIFFMFLLKFAIRDIEFRKSRMYKLNNFEKLPLVMSPKPLIVIEVRIRKILDLLHDSKSDNTYKFEIMTKPSLDDIWSDFNSMIDLFISSVSRIRRIDDMVIPTLKLKKNTMMQVEKNKQPKISSQIKLISSVIEYIRVQPDAKMLNLKSYQAYLDMNFDSLILDLKMKTYSEQNSNQNQDKNDNNQMLQNAAGEVGENEEAGGHHIDLEAYKDIEVSERVYMTTFSELRDAYWNVLLEIDSEYDYGIIVLDCGLFKKMVSKHIENLLKQLTDFILDEFLRKMNSLYSQYDMVEKRSAEKSNTIDDVIVLLEFIENIQRPEDLLEELEAQLEELKSRKNFIDDVALALVSSDYEKFLHLFSFPMRLRILLVKRKFQLENEREVLSSQMAEEKDRVLKAILAFRDSFEFFKKVGLYRPVQTSQAPNASNKEEQVTPVKVILSKKKVSKQDSMAVESKKKSILNMTDDQGNQFVPQYISENAARMEKLKSDLENTEMECEIINRREKLLNFRQTKFTAVANLKADMAPFITLWSIASNFTRVYEAWIYGPFTELESDKMDEFLQEWVKQLTRISKTLLATYPQPLTLVNYLNRELERFREYMPMIQAMRSKGLEKRHWVQMSKQLEFEFTDPSNLTLAQLIEMKLFEGPKLEIIKSISEVAMKEWAIKTTLDSLDSDLKIIDFSLAKYKDYKDTFVLRGLDDLMTIFEEYTLKVVSLKQNAFSKVFSERIYKIEKEFRIIVDILEEWIKTSKSWIYLEPIFSQKDLAEQMVTETIKFNSLDTFYKKELTMIKNEPNVHKYCRRETVYNSLIYANQQFESIIRGLSAYLEAKREHFSRFYFLSNEEIIEILGQIRDPRNVQKFLNKIFEGVDGLQFGNNGYIQGVYSKEEEHLPLKRSVDPTQYAERWLGDLEIKMKEAVQNAIESAYADYRMKDLESWVKMWQGQAVLVVLSIILSEVLTDIFVTGQVKRLKDALNQIVFEIETLTKLVRVKLDQNIRISICSLLTNRVHARDTLKTMIESDARYAKDFQWKLFMKYEYALLPKRSLIEELRKPLPKENIDAFSEQEESLQQQTSGVLSEPSINRRGSNFMDFMGGVSPVVNPNKPPTQNFSISIKDLKELCVSMIDARKPYGYEYLGNSQRLVITPLTDRCFRALFMALHFNYGGSPEGPVGTGKTETTKDLSKCLGKQCFVFNCSSSLNYDSMSKFFKGLATCGAWSCFDEFNRIELSVLSVISQIIIVMQSAIRESKTDMVFEDTIIKFNKECAIFITMNPQFIGRYDLPDNLKSLFRPVAMIVPDSALISEIHLYSFGFLQAKPLAKKIVRAFRLAKQQLSSQIHYEFGLRSIKIVLQIAGLMKLKASGVIEPDFKFKEGKKKTSSRNDNEDEKNPRPDDEGGVRQSDDLEKRLSRNDRATFVDYRRRQESSLDTDDGIRRKRQDSLDSEELDINDDIMLKKQELALPGKRVEDMIKEKTEKDQMKKKDPDVRYRALRTHNHEVSWRGMQKFSHRRKQFARGNILRRMENRMQAQEEFKDEAKQTKKLMKVLGIDNVDDIKDEEKIEEFIVLRAINDTNVPKLHQNDNVIFKGIIDDIFPNPIKKSTERNSLKTLLEEITHNKSLSMTDEIMERVLHLADTVMIRHGVMVVGQTMTGKTTIIQLLQECLNKSRENEVEECIQEYKLKKAKKMALTKLTKKQFQDDNDFDLDALREQEDEVKNMELSFEEVKHIRHQCKNKGVATFTINPKVLTLGQLMGSHDEISRDWNDGIMAHAMRICSKDTSERRNWIIFDGPIDSEWVENLNSVLDDNKKLTLSTGECIKLTGLMTIILEAEDLSNSTPATISRCGMIYLRDDIVPLKAIINQWIKKLPLFLEECAPELDSLSNYFIPEILDKYLIQANLIYPVTKKWAVKNFCRLMDAMINDYRSEKFNQLGSLTQAALAVYLNPKETAGTRALSRESDRSNMKRQETQTTHTQNSGQSKKPFNLAFAEVEARFQNAIRNKNIWVQNFFLFCLVWAFGSILRLEFRGDFEQHIKSKIVCNTEEIATIAQLKTKFQKKQNNPIAANQGKGNARNNSDRFGGVGGAGDQSDQRSMFTVTSFFLEPEKPPYILTPIPPGSNMFDIYFDLETNQWHEWESLKLNPNKNQQQDDGGLLDNTAAKRNGSSAFTKFIPTIETIRLGYLVETHIVARNNLMLIGPTGCGKSWLSRDILFKQIPVISNKYKSYSMVYSNGTTAEKAQVFIDSRLEKRRKGVYGPPLSQKYVFFIDDLMMPYQDRFGSQAANELLRQWFDFSGWFDTKTLDFKKVDDIQFLSCITNYDSTKSAISTRNEWHWSFIGAVTMDEKHYQSLFTQILEPYTYNWPAACQGSSLRNCVKATLDLYQFFEANVKPTPSKFLYFFNIRHMFKIIHGIAEVEPSYMSCEYHFGKLWMHEVWRTLCDRICDAKEAKMINKKIRQIAKKYFKPGSSHKYSKVGGRPFFSWFNKGSEGLYFEAMHFSETTQYLKRYLNDYNEMNKKSQINVVLFDSMVEFLMKVLRIIKQPFSHCIMIGIEGCGKEALCRMAVYLANYQYHKIKFDANYTQEDWNHDMKHLLTTSGIDLKEIVFHLKHNQIIKESFLDDLNCLVNNGEIQNLFSKDDYETIVQQVSARLQSLHKKTNFTLGGGASDGANSYTPKDNGNQINSQTALGDFSQKCRENLKVVLNFTPTGANLRQRLRLHKQLLNCSTVIWMEKWPTEGYKEVAATLLPEQDEDEITELSLMKDPSLFKRDKVVDIAMKIHNDSLKLCKDYFFESQHYIHVTPQLFQDFLRTYKLLYTDKANNLTEIRQRYEMGLERLRSTQEQVEKFSSQLESNAPLLIDKQIEVDRMLEKLREDNENLGRKKDILSAEEKQIIIQREQADLIREECEANLTRAMPELYQAIASLQGLSKFDINELKSLRNPPDAIKLLMECLCLILGVEPIKAKGKDGNFEKDYWTPSVGKQVLGNPRLVDNLSQFDSTSVSQDVMAALEVISKNPNFVLEQVQNASNAAKGLFCWLQAVKNYFYVYQETVPKRDALFHSEKQMLKKEKEIEHKRMEVSDLQEQLNSLRARHKSLQKEVDGLQNQIDECSVKKDRAGKLLNGLGGEKQKWLVCNRMIDKRFVTIQGDVLLGAAFITYLSPFTQKFRDKACEKWSDIITQHEILIQDSFSFVKIFGEPIKIKEWNFNGLPSDSFSIQNAIILEKSLKQTICIDPQYQANKWLKTQFAKEIKVLNFSDQNFVQHLEFSVKFGKKVLIENVAEKVDLIIYPLIKKEYTVEASQTLVNIYGHMVEMDQHFKLFIISEYKNPKFGPDISIITTQVNFHVTIEGLEEQMLSIVISCQKSELEENNIRMRREALQYIKILKALEEEILDSLSYDIDSILSNAKLVETLQTSKRTSRQIGENLQKVNKSQAILLKSRGIYTPAAYRAAILYFLVSDLSKIEQMYQFSLKWYIDIFTEEIKNNRRTDQDPLLDIIKNFTHTFYRKVCQSIFEKDKLLFTFLLAFRILEGDNCLDERLFDFFLKGSQISPDSNPTDEEISNTLLKTKTEFDEDENYQRKQSAILHEDNTEDGLSKKNTQKLEDEMERKKRALNWISEVQWQSLERLSKIPPFNRPNIVKHVLDNSDQWFAYATAKETENVQMPGPYMDYDPAKEEKRMKQKKRQLQQRKKELKYKMMQIEEISENDESEVSAEIDEDDIWHLDDDESDEDGIQDINQMMGSDANSSSSQDEADENQVADSIVSGVNDYQEIRFGSVKFEKELLSKKQIVLKDLIKFCTIRIFSPEKIIKEIQRFLGSFLDPRFMEPPVFNLPQLYQETKAIQPILFIQSANTNVLNELNVLKLQINDPQMSIEYLPLGGNVGEKVTQLIMKCAINGSWLLLENLHLVTNWIPTLEKFIQEMIKEDKKSSMGSGASRTSINNSPGKRQPVLKTQGSRENSQGLGGGITNQQTSKQQQEIAMFPELIGIKINPKFRLWLSSMPVDYFPVSFIQDCVKITLQPLQGIRQNTMKLLSQTGYDYLQRCPLRQSEFRKLYFAMTIFHAVIVERQRFGPIGFGQGYQFSENDFIISSLQLQYLVSRVQTEDEPLPLELARYMIGTLNYGGRIVKLQDEITLNAILDTFMNSKTCSEAQYRLTGDYNTSDTGFYYIPGEGDIVHYKNFISKFPVQDRAEIFGLHKNAIVQRQSHDGKLLLERVFEFEFASKEIMKASAILMSNDTAVGGDAGDDDEEAEDKARSFKSRIVKIIKELPELLDESQCTKLYPISYEHCFNILIKKEVERYNMLMQVIYITLKNTLKALEGVIHINDQLEEVYKSLTYEHVPTSWNRYSYPCFKSLGLFISNLNERVQFIRSFLDNPYSQNDIKKLKEFWLPGFFDQQGFFTTLLQQKARNDKISIETLAVSFTIIKDIQVEQTIINNKGTCLINGLWLEAAKWVEIDHESQQPITLQDSNDGYGLSLYQLMPRFLLDVIHQGEYDRQYINEKYYQCPLYMIGLRERLENGFGGETAAFTNCLITKVPLYIGASGPSSAKSSHLRQPGFWIKRGTALLCHKED